MKLNKITQLWGRVFRNEHNENLQIIEDEVNHLHQNDKATNARIDNLVLNAGGDDITQVIDALVDRKGKKFPTLNNLLTTKDQEYADQFAKAQLTKITSDNGNVRYTLNSENDDILDFIARLSPQMFTIYSNLSVKNNPGKGSGRCIGHITTAGHGWVTFYETTGEIFHNYMFDGVWRGWEKVVKESDFNQKTLWSGATFAHEDITITPTKKITDCKNGWLLVWSDYELGVGANDFDFAYSIVPKTMAVNHNGKQSMFLVPVYVSEERSVDVYIIKILKITSSQIIGHKSNIMQNGGFNGVTDHRDVVLRYVLEL